MGPRVVGRYRRHNDRPDRPTGSDGCPNRHEGVSETSAWEQLAPVLFDAERWAQAGAEVDLVVGSLGLRPPATVLDLACGPGRHLLELARRGFRVTGVDATAGFVAKARRAVADEGLEAEVVHEDMRRFCRVASFDAVISMSTSFGYFTEDDGDRRVLENIRRCLRPGGGLLMELMGKEVVARTLKGQAWREEHGVLLLTEQHTRDDWTWVDNRLIVVAGERRQELVLSHRLYSAAELRSLLEGCGFTSVQLYGALDGSPYDSTAERLVAVARTSSPA